MDREKFLSIRQTGIGGSDVAAILGISRYKTPQGVYAQKTGEAEPIPDNEPMAIGRALEPVVLDFYERATGVKLIRSPETIRHPDYPFLIGNLDAYHPGVVVEAKTSFDARDWGEEGTDDIPIDYWCQTQHYMLLTGFPLAAVPVFFRGERSDTFRIYQVPADPAFQQKIIERGQAFWEGVKAHQPPPPMTFEEQAAAWQRMAASSKTHIVHDAIGADLGDITLLRQIREDIEVLEAEESRLCQSIQSRMQEADTLMMDGRPIVTWRINRGRRGIDAKRLEEEEPAIFERFKTEGKPYRTFIVKA